MNSLFGHSYPHRGFEAGLGMGNLSFWLHLAAYSGILLVALLAVLGGTALLISIATRGKGYDR